MSEERTDKGVVREIEVRRFSSREEGSVFNAIERSRNIIDAARADAESLLEDARQLAEEERARGYQDGFEQGRLQAAAAATRAAIFDSISQE